jgi:hypothetical protein
LPALARRPREARSPAHHGRTPAEPVAERQGRQEPQGRGAQLAQNARLQASLAEAEAIAARERMRASEVERKLTEMAELLSASAAREDELRTLLETASGGDPTRRTEFIDQSLDLARLNARLAEADGPRPPAPAAMGTATAPPRRTPRATPEQATAEFEARQTLQNTSTPSAAA